MKRFFLFTAVFSALLLSGCFIESAQSLHSNMEHILPPHFFETGEHVFAYAEDPETEERFFVTIYNDHLTASHSDFSEMGTINISDIVRSYALPKSYYLAVFHENEKYRYFLFKYNEKASFTFFHDCTTNLTEETEAGLIENAKACIEKYDGTKYIKVK